MELLKKSSSCQLPQREQQQQQQHSSQASSPVPLRHFSVLPSDISQEQIHKLNSLDIRLTGQEFLLFGTPVPTLRIAEFPDSIEWLCFFPDTPRHATLVDHQKQQALATMLFDAYPTEPGQAFMHIFDNPPSILEADIKKTKRLNSVRPTRLPNDNKLT